ncbi:MAG TPA: nitrilase family protein [Bacteroidetes bacterium]|nr:nitrilase family protein [Bacteroidota bacterium]
MKNLKIGIIQTDLFWEKADENRQMLNPKIAKLACEGAQLIIMPEMVNSGFSMDTKKIAESPKGKTQQWMQAKSQKHDVTLIASLCVEENGKYFNRLLICAPNKKTEHYDKRHLFAFGEEDKYYTAGNKQKILSLYDWNISFGICYDLRFPVWLKNSYQDNSYGYDVLVLVANWPEKRNYQWEQLLIARAIENQAFVVGVNRIGTDGREIYYCGNSLVINPIGEIIYRGAKGKEDIALVELEKERLIHYRERMNCGKDWDDFQINY